MKIRYQSYVDRELAAPYFRALEQHLEAVRDSDVEIEALECTPPIASAHAMNEMRAGYVGVRHAVAAEREGCDAFIIGHFQDAGLAEAKAAVDIPVIGLGETTLLHACSLGRMLGLVTINPRFVAWHRDQIRGYGLEARVTGIEALSFQPGDFMQAFDDAAQREQVRERFREQAQPLAAAGADVIIPAGGIPMLIMADSRPVLVGEAPVLDGIAIAVRMARLAVELKRLNGTAVSRASSYARPDARTLEAFLTHP